MEKSGKKVDFFSHLARFFIKGFRFCSVGNHFWTVFPLLGRPEKHLKSGSELQFKKRISRKGGINLVDVASEKGRPMGAIGSEIDLMSFTKKR